MPHVLEVKIMGEISDVAGASRMDIVTQCTNCVIDRLGVPLLQRLE
jgi:hypothetical protein